MALPELKHWGSTRDALHQVTQIIGAVRVASSDALPNDLQYSVEFIPGGISSGFLNIGGTLRLDFGSFTVSYENEDGVVFTLEAMGQSQMSLMQILLEKFKTIGITIEPSMKHIHHENPFDVDRVQASDYALVLDTVYTALSRFRGRLGGGMSPIVIWPHHFDMAFMWFVQSDKMNEYQDGHIAIGFAPFSDGIERPYFYGYGWSKDTGYIDVTLDPPAQAITDSYTGLYVEYDKLHTHENFNQIIEEILLAYYHKAASELN